MLFADECADQIEQALLGAILTTGQVELPSLLADEFFLEGHRVMWQAILSVRSQGQHPDLIAVYHELRQTGQIDTLAGGPAYLAQCVESGCLALYVNDYADRIRAASTSRKLRQLGAELHEQGFSEQEVQDRLARIPRPRTARRFSGGEVWTAVQLQWLEPPILLGLPDVDRRARLRAGDLVVVGGRTSHGKTALLVSSAMQMLADGLSVTYLSLETPAESIWRRAVAVRGRIAMTVLRGGTLGPSEFQIADEVSAQLAQQPFVIRDVRALGSKQAPRILDALSADPANVLMLDHVQEVITPGDNRPLELALFFARLKELALAQGCVLICAAQLSRLTDRMRGLPVLADLKESGGIEERADVVLLLHHWARAGADRSAEDLEVIVAKNRDGDTGRCCMRFEQRYGLVTVPGAPALREPDGGKS